MADAKSRPVRTSGDATRRTFVRSACCLGAVVSSGADPVFGETRLMGGQAVTSPLADAGAHGWPATFIVHAPDRFVGCRVVEVRGGREMEMIRSAMGAKGWCVPFD